MSEHGKERRKGAVPVMKGKTREEKLNALLRLAPELRSLLMESSDVSAPQGETFFDQMPGGFFIYEATGEEALLYANQAMVRLMGCETMEEFYAFTHCSFRGIVHPDDYEAVEKSIWEQIHESQFDLDYVEYRVLGKDGKVRWIDDYGHYVCGDNGEEFFYVFVADSTDKRLRETRARASALEEANSELKRRLRIIEALSRDYSTIFYVDVEKNTLQPYQLSPRTRGLFQMGGVVPLEGFADHYIETWVYPDDQQAMEMGCDRAYMRRQCAEKGSYSVEYRVVENEETRYMVMRVVDVSEDGSGSQAVVGYRMVDDEVRQEMGRRTVLEVALQQAKAAAQAKDTFLANMSHDIRTPMNAVVGYSTLIRSNMDDPGKVKDYLDHIDAASGRMLQIIDNVLDLSEMESGSARLVIAPFDLRQSMERVGRSMEAFARQKGVALTMDLSGIRHEQVYADEEKLRLVAEQLLHNAIQYTNASGQVRAAVTERGAPTRDFARFTLEVTDTGLGIDPAYLTRIFEPFERQQNTTFSGVPGVGLGLTIVKSTVEMMGGDIQVESTPGQGSRFTVSLNLRVAREDAGQDAAAPSDKASRSGRRILVVDDNDLNLELCSELLSESGFLVETATNGRIAVDKIAASAPGYFAMVLMDIQMPVMDGNEATRAIRALKDPALAAIPIVALSANAREEDRKRSMESGMNAHLAKPFQLDELLGYLDNFD